MQGGGGGWGLGFFLAASYFFSLFAQQVFFSKVNFSKFFFEKITRINQKNVNERTHSKNLTFLLYH